MTDTKRIKTSTEKLTKGTIIFNSLLHLCALQWLMLEMLSYNSNKWPTVIHFDSLKAINDLTNNYFLQSPVNRCLIMMKKRLIIYFNRVRDTICQIILKSMTLDWTLLEPSGPNIQTRIYTSEATGKRKDFFLQWSKKKRKEKKRFQHIKWQQVQACLCKKATQ